MLPNDPPDNKNKFISLLIAHEGLFFLHLQQHSHPFTIQRTRVVNNKSQDNFILTLIYGFYKEPSKIGAFSIFLLSDVECSVKIRQFLFYYYRCELCL